MKFLIKIIVILILSLICFSCNLSRDTINGEIGGELLKIEKGKIEVYTMTYNKLKNNQHADAKEILYKTLMKEKSICYKNLAFFELEKASARRINQVKELCDMIDNALLNEKNHCLCRKNCLKGGIK